MRQLLGHAAGLQREPDGPWWERPDGADLDDLLAALTPDEARLPAAPRLPLLQPGVRAARRGRAPAHRRAVVGAWSPSGCWTRWHDRTTYQAEEPFARGYVVHPWHDTLREEPRTDAGAMAPAGQLWSTADDLTKWAAFLAEPTRQLARATLAEMCAPVVISDLDSWTTGTAWAWSCSARGERVSSGTAARCPATWRPVAVHRPAGTGVVAFANAYTLHGPRIAELGRRLLDDGARRRADRALAARARRGEPHELYGRGGGWAAEYERAGTARPSWWSRRWPADAVAVHRDGADVALPQRHERRRGARSYAGTRGAGALDPTNDTGEAALIIELYSQPDLNPPRRGRRARSVMPWKFSRLDGTELSITGADDCAEHIPARGYGAAAPHPATPYRRLLPSRSPPPRSALDTPDAGLVARGLCSPPRPVGRSAQRG